MLKVSRDMVLRRVIVARSRRRMLARWTNKCDESAVLVSAKCANFTRACSTGCVRAGIRTRAGILESSSQIARRSTFDRLSTLNGPVSSSRFKQEREQARRRTACTVSRALIYNFAQVRVNSRYMKLVSTAILKTGEIYPEQLFKRVG